MNGVIVTPVLMTVEELVRLVDDVRSGLLSGDTDEGSLEFSLPVMDDRVSFETLALLEIPDQDKWDVVQDTDEAMPTMYEPKPGMLWVKGIYRTGRRRGQGSVRVVGWKP